MKLNALERRQAEAILTSFAPENRSGLSQTDGLVPTEGEVDYTGNLEKMANAMSARARLGIRLAIRIVSFAPLWTGMAFATMSGIPVEKRSALLERMLVSNSFIVRELALVMKIGASFALFASKSIRARSHYDDRVTARVQRPSTGEPARDVPRPRALPVLRPSHPGMG